MRVRLPIRRSLFFLAALLLFVLLSLPLRLVAGWLDLSSLGVSAREADGSIWSGRLSEARVGGAPLGDLTAALDPLPLLLGRVRIAVAREGETADPLSGAITLARHSIGVEDVTVRLPLGQRLAPVPLTAIELGGVSVTFRDGLCAHADGLVKARIDGAPAALGLPASMSGAARCDAGALLLPLMGPGGMDRLTVRLNANRAYRAALTIKPATSAAAEALGAVGLQPVASGGYGLAMTGRW